MLARPRDPADRLQDRVEQVRQRFEQARDRADQLISAAERILAAQNGSIRSLLPKSRFTPSRLTANLEPPAQPDPASTDSSAMNCSSAYDRTRMRVHRPSLIATNPSAIMRPFDQRVCV